MLTDPRCLKGDEDLRNSFDWRDPGDLVGERRVITDFRKLGTGSGKERRLYVA